MNNAKRISNENPYSGAPKKESGEAPALGEVKTVSLRAPYGIYFGDVDDIGYAKTGLGLIEWRRALCACQFRSPGCKVDGGLPEFAIEEAAASGVKSLIIGVAAQGGRISDSWLADLVAAARAGLDIVSGMHVRLGDFPEVAAAAEASGARLIDVRTPPGSLPVGAGVKRSGKRLLTVGTDCAVGKKYTALSMEKEMRRRGWNADFRATGQTGIMIAGSGVPIDSVVSDFISGAAEVISPASPDDHWDVIEGQGALAHPGYAGVSLGLLHGSQPDALVLCHDASRTHMLGAASPGLYPLQSLSETMEINLALARRVNPGARFVGVSINSSRVDAALRDGVLARYREETGLPVVDPIINGAEAIVDYIEQEC